MVEVGTLLAVLLVAVAEMIQVLRAEKLERRIALLEALVRPAVLEERVATDALPDPRRDPPPTPFPATLRTDAQILIAEAILEELEP